MLPFSKHDRDDEGTSEHSSPCKLEGSSAVSGRMLQKSSASPILGFTGRPFLAHSDIPFHPATGLTFPVAAGNTVSPPSSTSDLHNKEIGILKLHIVCQNIYVDKGLTST